MEDCIFCKIIKKDIPAKIIYEDEYAIAFLDLSPASKGHTLVVPKKHTDNIKTVNIDDLEKSIETVKKISIALLNFNEGVNVIQNNGLVAGQIVDHIHFHVVPRNEGDGIRWDRPSKKFNDKEREEIKNKIKSFL